MLRINEDKVWNYYHNRTDMTVFTINRYCNRGNATLFAAFVLFALMAFGGNYLISSRSAAAVISREADTITARNLAKAAFESARLIIKDSYAMKQAPLMMTEPLEHNLAKGSDISGSWEILKIVPLKDAGFGSSPSEGWKDMIYMDAYGKELGKYDVYEVTTRGKASGTGVAVELKALVKVIRWTVAP